MPRFAKKKTAAAIAKEEAARKLAKHAMAITKLRRAHNGREAMLRAARQKIIDHAVSVVGKQVGVGALVPFTMIKRSASTACISTGWPALDDLITGDVEESTMKTIAGTGLGLPKGRIIELYGPESTGKTTLVLEWIAEVQRQGGVCAFIDAEHALDMPYARKLGVDLDTLLFNQPESAEQALNIVDEAVKIPGMTMVVVDSVAALTPQAEQDGDVGAYHVGLHARLMSQALRKLTASVAATGVIVIFINQIRMKIGVRFGNPETTPGGNALKFYASVRLDIRRRSTLRKGGVVVGIRSKLRTVKNKVATPSRECYLNIERGLGITEVHATFDPKKGIADADDDEGDDE